MRWGRVPHRIRWLQRRQPFASSWGVGSGWLWGPFPPPSPLPMPPFPCPHTHPHHPSRPCPLSKSPASSFSRQPTPTTPTTCLNVWVVGRIDPSPLVWATSPRQMRLHLEWRLGCRQRWPPPVGRDRHEGACRMKGLGPPPGGGEGEGPRPGVGREGEGA